MTKKPKKDKSEDILNPELQKQEESLDKSLRPKDFKSFIGQKKLKENLNIQLEAAKKRNDAIEHVLLYGPAGIGKTTLASVIANEIGTSFRITSGPAIERAGDLASILTNLKDNDILFIDASQYYEKVKTQNYLRDEDVDRIVDTFAKRITIDKYSYVASLDEVRENDYNLNIPRYVDTFEEEEPVDIDAVASELKELETEMKDTDNTIAGFCKELNIPTPF